MGMPSRRTLLVAPAAALLAASLRGTPALASGFRDETPWPGFPQQIPDLVRDVVGASHSNIDRVRELTDKHPALVNAAWDWGFGDWETALGAAAHTGRREIAELLIARGARIDVFAATMLGRLDVVTALIEFDPGIARTVGPHGIPLLAHARAGGEAAKPLLEYLSKVPGSGDGHASQPLEESLKAWCVGVYTLNGGGEFEIILDRERLGFRLKNYSTRFLNYLGNEEFFPVGVPSVRFKFAAGGERAASVHISDHDLRMVGTRRA